MNSKKQHIQEQLVSIIRLVYMIMVIPEIGGRLYETAESITNVASDLFTALQDPENDIAAIDDAAERLFRAVLPMTEVVNNEVFFAWLNYAEARKQHGTLVDHYQNPESDLENEAIFNSLQEITRATAAYEKAVKQVMMGLQIIEVMVNADLFEPAYK